MNKVLAFPITATITPEQALEHAKEQLLTDVLIAGYKDNGDLYVRSSRMTRADALWLAESLKAWALGTVN